MDSKRKARSTEDVVPPVFLGNIAGNSWRPLMKEI